LIVVIFISCERPLIHGDILIENGIVYDGKGNAEFRGDIVIENEMIKWIGDAKQVETKCNEVIDASGKIVTPGFIDIHAHGNPLKTPKFQNFLAMGVTTIALGMDGSSQEVSNMDDWIKDVKSTRTGVNILPFIGHGSLRKESGIGNSKEVSKADLAQMSLLLDKALKKGVWGLSFGLEYLPGFYADSIELSALAKVVGQHNALITSHIRNEDDNAIVSSLTEMFNLSEFCNVNISHLKVVYAKGKERAQEIMSLFDKPLNSNYNITADLYPYTASYTGIGIVFPEWAKRPKTYGKIKQQRRNELLTHLRNRVNSRNGPDATLFGSAPYKGKTLKDLEEEYNLPFEQILADVIGPYGGSAAFFVMDEELQKELVKHPEIMIASDGSPTMFHPRGHGTFSKIIEDFVLQDSTIELAEAIYKMTGMPAKTLGLTKRGVLEKGMMADLLIFDPSEVKSKATFDMPHQYSKGIETVMINGLVVFKNDSVIIRNGKVLIRPESQKTMKN